MYALIAFSGIYVAYVVYNEFKFYKENLGGSKSCKDDDDQRKILNDI